MGLFVKERIVELLLSMRDGPKTVNDMEKLTNLSYSSVVNHLHSWKRDGFVVSHRYGREQDWSLTRAGEELALNMLHLKECMGDIWDSPVVEEVEDD